MLLLVIERIWSVPDPHTPIPSLVWASEANKWESSVLPGYMGGLVSGW